MPTTVTSLNLFQITLNLLLPLVQLIIPILVSFAILGFFWGVSRYIWNAGDEKKRAEGKNVMIWGIAALFLFLSIVGIVNVLQTTFGIGGNPTIVPPSANPCQYNLGGSNAPCPQSPTGQ